MHQAVGVTSMPNFDNPTKLLRHIKDMSGTVCELMLKILRSDDSIGELSSQKYTRTSHQSNSLRFAAMKSRVRSSETTLKTGLRFVIPNHGYNIFIYMA